ELDKLGRLDDEEVIAHLTAVSGIGLWSAHMFLMFHLQRPDVLPVGDLGIHKGFQRAYGLTELPAAPEMEQIAQPWRPYRSVACLFLWRLLSATPV
ncbi:MAG: DNA-3-methyladenine glycosylase family protein, partial [Solirubrobacteraceae bacterium]